MKKQTPIPRPIQAPKDHKALYSTLARAQALAWRHFGEELTHEVCNPGKARNADMLQRKNAGMSGSMRLSAHI